MAGDSPTRKLPPMAAGQRYGRLVAVEFVELCRGRDPKWRFRCDCGQERVIVAYAVRGGKTQSCGCLRNEKIAAVGHKNAVHGMWSSPEHASWTHMKERCTNPNCDAFPDYGGRGIKICERWMVFENFYADMGPRPSLKHTLDRHPNKDGDYEPSNCRWATKKEQAGNRRSTIMVAFQGQEMSLSEACRLTGAKYTTVQYRLAKGWTLERALKP